MPYYPYDSGAGVRYARSFALMDTVPENERLFFYDPNDDCTNFISQCVWSAYGGWVPGSGGASVSVNALRIRRDVRQVPGVWFGSHAHIGSTRWCRVEEFYRFVTARKPDGPAAVRIADGDFRSVDPLQIRTGDVIQLVVNSYTPDRFGHGLYVTQAGSGWAGVLICCHTYNRLDSPMSEFASQPAVYPRLRVLRFGPGAFSS